MMEAIKYEAQFGSTNDSVMALQHGTLGMTIYLCNLITLQIVESHSSR